MPIDKKGKILSLFSYEGPAGKEVFQVVRMHPKEFRVRHKDDKGQWVWRAPPENYPYHLPEILKSEDRALIFIVEGEKDVETLRKAGQLATCNRGGAGKGDWSKSWGKYFIGKRVCIIPDNDGPGRKHAEMLWQALENAAAEIAVLVLPGLGDKEDVTDWLAKKENTTTGLMALVDQAFYEQAKHPVGAPIEANGKYPHGDAWEGPDVESHDPDDDDEVDKSWKPFPVEVLTGPVKAYILAAARALQCDPAYVALPCLVCLGGAMGNSRIMRLKETWLEPCVFWGIVIADSSTMKSPAADVARAPLVSLQAELFMEWERDMSGYRRALREWELAPKAERLKMAQFDDKDGPAKPTPRRIIVEDITVEKLALIVFDNPRGVTLVSDELAGWLSSFTRYQTGHGGGSTLPFWLEVFRAQGKMIDRKNGDPPSIWVNRLAVSVFGTIQPSTFVQHFSEQLVNSGFASRLLMAMPPRRPKVWTEDVIPPDTRGAYSRLVTNLYTLETPQSHEKMYKPREIDFSIDGRMEWEAWYNAWADRQAQSEGETAYALAKLEAYCARFALLLATMDNLCGEHLGDLVERQHVSRAAQLVDWFAQESCRVYHMLRTPAQDLADHQLVEYIRHRKGEITARCLFLANPSRWGSVRTCKSALERLVADGKGAFEVRRGGPEGGRPSTVFVVKTNETKPNGTFPANPGEGIR